ncbi:hypothetical protein PQX77_009694 [Marasmius sp. AFHP31]|nr:hypothetical protein PQX77_009694 [Marasmius sp. AFHP31]
MATSADGGDLELQIPPTLVYQSFWQKTCILSRLAADKIHGRTTVQDFIQCKHSRTFKHHVNISMGRASQAWGLLRISGDPGLPKCKNCNKHESHLGDEYMNDVARIFLESFQSVPGGQAAKHRADVRRWHPNVFQSESTSGPRYPSPPLTSPSSSQAVSQSDPLPSSSPNSGRFSPPEPAPFIDLTLSPESSSEPRRTRKRKADSRAGSPVPKRKGKQRCTGPENYTPLNDREVEYIAGTVALTEELIESPGDISRGLEEVLIDLRYQLMMCSRF